MQVNGYYVSKKVAWGYGWGREVRLVDAYSVVSGEHTSIPERDYFCFIVYTNNGFDRLLIKFTKEADSN
ncbi:MAG: hypothetical protein NTW65_01875 [Deltaproteobacteria bacterium]|nr:hypothetical protein [Deltaproteobacteria bacterium]